MPKQIQLTVREVLELALEGLRNDKVGAVIRVLEQAHEQCPEGVLYTQDTLTHLRKTVEAVLGLIEESEGVAGLHLNGDLAGWASLLRGGAFEEWLLPLCDAADFLKEVSDAKQVVEG